MKKLSKVLLFTFVFTFVLTTYVRAEGESGRRSNTNWGEMKTEAIARQEEIKAELIKRREEAKEKIDEKKDNLAKLHAERLSNRFGFYTKRLATVVEKIEERIEKMKDDGKDTSAAEAKLTEAKTKLTLANDLSKEAIAMFAAIDTSKYEEEREKAQEARNKAMQARQTFVEAVKLLRETVKILKELNE